MKLLVLGGGWAGLAAAVSATQRGWQVVLCEASRTLGGRARSVSHAGATFDNGQHVLIGAYRDTLALLRTVGVDPEQVFHRQPLDLRLPDGTGLRLPDLPPPWNALLGIAQAQGWTWADRWSLLQAALRWRLQGFVCPADWTVRKLCHGLSERVMQEMIEPLCVSALNTPSQAASAEVFLRVMQDGLFSGHGSSDILMPRVPLGDLLPHAAQRWLMAHGAEIQLGTRVTDARQAQNDFQADALLLACSNEEAARLTAPLNTDWSAMAASLAHTAITTVSVRCQDPAFKGIGKPLQALHSDAQHPAQFVAERDGVLSFVVSDSQGTRENLMAQVMAQARQLWQVQDLELLYCATEKRATFACTPQLKRPGAQVSPGVWACGDYIAGPYPATLEGAVRSGLQVLEQIAEAGIGQRL